MLEQHADIAPRDLNAIIFDYMVVEGMSEAAVEFARETGISSTIDQEAIQERMEIRQAVEDGRVEEAVRRVNELDPEVSLLFFILPTSHFFHHGVSPRI